MTFLIIMLIIAGSFGFYLVTTYNSFISMIEINRNNQKQIDIQLDRRFKVLESLINVVKKYMDYEQTTLKDVIAMRNQAQAAHQKGDEKTRNELENKISSIASNINVVFEQYPDLKANENSLQLREEIINTENKLAFAKQSLNDGIERFNAAKNSFPGNIIVNFFKSKLDIDFPYWSLSSEQTEKNENYIVKF